MHVRACARASVRARACACVRACLRVRVRVHACACVHAHTPQTHTRTHARTITPTQEIETKHITAADYTIHYTILRSTTLHYTTLHTLSLAHTPLRTQEIETKHITAADYTIHVANLPQARPPA